ncbi:hypothetical protein N8376_04290 [Flavobacteriaceae bacterium]|nr:hypothetical protein [Flavobacteriaceae bacterium]MDC1492556.1 hypothetical protein [Flavobacteriaceae bacterium]
MKKIIIVSAIASLLLIFIGLSFTKIHIGFGIKSNQLVGIGVVGLFFFVFPVFSYYRWKDKDVKDYMLTKENIDKMNKTKN